VSGRGGKKENNGQGKLADSLEMTFMDRVESSLGIACRAKNSNAEFRMRTFFSPPPRMFMGGELQLYGVSKAALYPPSFSLPRIFNL
jgi:hypothetical protein